MLGPAFKENRKKKKKTKQEFLLFESWWIDTL